MVHDEELLTGKFKMRCAPSRWPGARAGPTSWCAAASGAATHRATPGSPALDTFKFTNCEEAAIATWQPQQVRAGIAGAALCHALPRHRPGQLLPPSVPIPPAGFTNVTMLRSRRRRGDLRCGAELRLVGRADAALTQGRLRQAVTSTAGRPMAPGRVAARQCRTPGAVAPFRTWSPTYRDGRL